MQAPITLKIPTDVSVALDQHDVVIQGPVGKIILNSEKLNPKTTCIKIEENTLSLLSFEQKSNLGTLSSHFQSAFTGVTKGFSIFLDIVGVGYRATLEEKEKQLLHLKVGHNYPISYEAPENVRLFCIQPTRICVFGASKELVTAVAAHIRSLRPPEPYKGKGIRLSTENVVLKEGKKK